MALLGNGGYAEQALAHPATTFALPDWRRRHDRAGPGAAGHHGLAPAAHERPCTPGETVVVHAAAGGVGCLAVQLAREMGAGRVIATASRAEKRDLARELGADVALDPGSATGDSRPA